MTTTTLSIETSTDTLTAAANKAHRANRREQRIKAKARGIRQAAVLTGDAPIKDVAIIEFFNMTGILTGKRQWNSFTADFYELSHPGDHLYSIKLDNIEIIFDYVASTLNLVKRSSADGRDFLVPISDMAALGRFLAKRNSI